MRFGFIGCGNMGGAIARGICAMVGGDRLVLANRTHEKAELLAKELGARAGSNADAARCVFVFLGVKPHLMEDMLRQLRPSLENNPEAVLVSMAAGLTTLRIREMAGTSNPVIRIMPNTPAAYGVGMIQYCMLDVRPEQEKVFLSAMSKCGRLDPLAEELIDAASAVSGCGPAFACIFAEALADGGVACGLPRAAALEYAAQMLIGTGTMLLESGKHPGSLKDSVCSPGGSTIQGVRVLEEAGLRGAVMDAVIAAFEKNRDLGKK